MVRGVIEPPSLYPNLRGEGGDGLRGPARNLAHEIALQVAWLGVGVRVRARARVRVRVRIR